MQGVRASVNRKMRRRAHPSPTAAAMRQPSRRRAPDAVAVGVHPDCGGGAQSDARPDRRQYETPGSGCWHRLSTARRVWPAMAQQKTRSRGFFRSESWCPGEDSNLHGFTR